MATIFFFPTLLQPADMASLSIYADLELVKKRQNDRIGKEKRMVVCAEK
jgi:hypothetical protein